jgi:hypothetical protein
LNYFSLVASITGSILKSLGKKATISGILFFLEISILSKLLPPFSLTTLETN